MSLEDLLMPYQKEIALDDSKRIIIAKSRQIGITSGALSLRAVRRCLDHNKRASYYISNNQDRRKEFIEHCTYMAVEVLFEVGALSEPDLDVAKDEGLIQQASSKRIVFYNGSKIEATPCKARSVRGASGDMYLDEMASYEHEEQIYTAAEPTINSSDSLSIVLCSTPNGASGLFYEIFSNPDPENKWSKYEISIHDAIEQGWSSAALDSKNSPGMTKRRWQQEYEVGFTTKEGQVFSNELLRAASIPNGDMPDRREIKSRHAGIDIARIHDKTVLVEVIETYDGSFVLFHVHLVKPAGQEMDLTEQQNTLSNLLRSTSFDSVTVDGNGIGSQIAQGLRASCKASKFRIVEGSQFKKTKDEYVPRVLQGFETQSIFIKDSSSLRDAFAAMVENTSSSGKTSYDLEKSKSGHGDEAVAFLMAYETALSSPNKNSSEIHVPNITSSLENKIGGGF